MRAAHINTAFCAVFYFTTICHFPRLFLVKLTMHNLKENEVGFASIFVLLVVARLFFVGQEERITSPPFSFLLPSPFFFFPFGICSSLFVRSRGILLHMESSACSSLRLPTLVFALCSRQANLDQNFPPCQRPHTHTRTHTHTHTHTPHAQIKGKRGFTNTARKNKNQKLLLGVCCVCLPLPPTFSKSTTPTTT